MKREIKITEVRILPQKANKGFLAYCSCIYNDELYFDNIGLLSKRDGEYRISFPGKKLGEKLFRSYYPIKKEVEQIILEALVIEYEKLLNK